MSLFCDHFFTNFGSDLVPVFVQTKKSVIGKSDMRAIRFWLKVGEIGVKCDKNFDFSRLMIKNVEILFFHSKYLKARNSVTNKQICTKTRTYE